MSTRANRYPGAQPFGDTALDRLRFRGRDTESDLLLHQLIGADLLVLFGKPGLGKTSLLNARLFPLLRERDFLPLSVRFNQSDSLPPMQVFIAAIEQVCEAEKIDYTPGSGDGLWEFFKTAVFWRGDRFQTPVLVLDQFEEMFTLQTEEFRRATAGELGELVSRRLPDRLRQRLQSGQQFGFSDRAPDVKVLLTLREDDLGLLQELTPQMPSILQNRFRLTPLSDADARCAVVAPAALVAEEIEFAARPFNYEPGTLEEIITAARSPRGGIDPLVLQLICAHVEREVHRRQQSGRKPETAITVDGSYLRGEAGIHALTAKFYLDCIKSLPEPRLRRRARAVCEEGLLTENGRRRSVLKEDLLKRFKLGPESLQMLEWTRLLRSEPRHGSFYYEISHDRIAEAIHRNRQWRMPRELKWALGIVFTFAVVVMSALALGAYHQFNQARSAQLRASRAQQEVEAARQQEKKLTTGVVNEFRRAGDANYNTQQFQQALANYQRACDFTKRDADPQLWAAALVDLGKAHEALGTRGEGANEHFAAAVTAFRKALEVYTREQFPQQWAQTQSNLGDALANQGVRTEGARETELLAQAVDAYHRALEVYTREAAPIYYKKVQENLAKAEDLLRQKGPSK